MRAARGSCARSTIGCGGCAPITSTSTRSTGPTRQRRWKKPRKSCIRCSNRERSGRSASAIFPSRRSSGSGPRRRCMWSNRLTIFSSAESRPISCLTAAATRSPPSAMARCAAVCCRAECGRTRPLWTMICATPTPSFRRPFRAGRPAFRRPQARCRRSEAD